MRSMLTNQRAADNVPATGCRSETTALGDTGGALGCTDGAAGTELIGRPDGALGADDKLAVGDGATGVEPLGANDAALVSGTKLIGGTDGALGADGPIVPEGATDAELLGASDGAPIGTGCALGTAVFGETGGARVLTAAGGGAAGVAPEL